MRLVMFAAASAALLSSLSPALAQPLQPASPTPCNALSPSPGADEGAYRCRFPNSNWSQSIPGQSHLQMPSTTWERNTYESARFQFAGGRLSRIDFVWRGRVDDIDGRLRSQRGAPANSGWEGHVFLTYPDTGDGWQVTLSGAAGGDQFTVTYLDRSRLSS
jgi:hypothetical protein